jgi:SAM-dependent methyltransferase
VNDNNDPDEPAYRRRFSWAMHHRSLDVAPKIAARINLRGAWTLLDLGGGPGTYALAFLKQNPTLKATVCDRAPALAVAREIAATMPHGKRLSYLPLDFVTKVIPGRYDAIWFSNVLHIYSPEENQRLFGKMAKALAPGGRLLIQDAFLHDAHGLHPQEASLFAVTMLLFTDQGNTYSVRDTTAWLERAGFGRGNSGGDEGSLSVKNSFPPKTITIKFTAVVIPLVIRIVCGTSGFVSPCTMVEISSASPTVPYITAAISAHR